MVEGILETGGGHNQVQPLQLSEKWEQRNQFIPDLEFHY